MELEPSSNSGSRTKTSTLFDPIGSFHQSRNRVVFNNPAMSLTTHNPAINQAFIAWSDFER
jgi:hypothetical protein